ncbi:hypothetical protein [Kitasatospora sp. NPDC056531]|uniref:hypothetical protein n=1 Tax=Kitasatospora sp. NPDC056531 TaxID=3345856 RepID=UPI0036CD3769
MLDALDLPADECVFVDDTERYLPPAAELGFATVHAKDPGQTISELEGLLGVDLSGRDRGR